MIVTTTATPGRGTHPSVRRTGGTKASSAAATDAMTMATGGRGAPHAAALAIGITRAGAAATRAMVPTTLGTSGRGTRHTTRTHRTRRRALPFMAAAAHDWAHSPTTMDTKTEAMATNKIKT